MNLSDYFNPVELDKPDLLSNLGNAIFYRNIYTHTQNNPVNNLEGIDLVIIGVEEDRNAHLLGAAKAPDEIRKKLYQLSAIADLKIVDLGNFKRGKEIFDTYVGLSEVITFLKKSGVNCLVIGGSNDIVYPLVKKDIEEKNIIDLTTIDARINFDKGNSQYNSENYLNILLTKKGEINLFYNNLGSQVYLNSDEILSYLDSKQFNLHRLGEVRENIVRYEPIIRNSDIVAVDICSVKQSEAQGQFYPSPNGFMGEEVCQLAWYAGFSEKTKIFGIFDVIPEMDINYQTTGLAAQIIWHYANGIANRHNEIPGKSKHFKKFIIGLETNQPNISFYKSELSDRWWLEISTNDPVSENIYVPCNQDDYDQACNNEIPDVWWKSCQRYNINQ